MDETTQIALFLSIILNLIFVGLGIVFLVKRGGITYLVRRIPRMSVAKNQITPMNEKPYFLDKKDHFQTLTKNGAEIVFLGDSLTDHCEWGELFGDSRIKNRGIAGDRTDGVLLRIDELLVSHPKKIFIMIGINDLIQGIEISNIVKYYKLILEKIHAKTPNTKVFIQSILPINNEKSKRDGVRLNNDKVIKLNTNLKELVEEFSFHYIDLFSYFCDPSNELDPRYTTDGVHLNGQAYLTWKGIIEKDVVN